MFAGYILVPEGIRFRLHEGWGKAAFWCSFFGFCLAFPLLHVVGLMGMTRRIQHYDVPEWHAWLLVAEFGAITVLAGILCQVTQLVVSIRIAKIAQCDRRPLDGPLARIVKSITAAGVQLRRPPLLSRIEMIVARGAPCRAWVRSHSRACLQGRSKCRETARRAFSGVLRHFRRVRHDLADWWLSLSP